VVRYPPLLTLLTDFGLSTYPGQMKGIIHTILPGAQVVDLTHHVPFADVGCAAHALLCAFGDFPSGTVHVAVVDPGVGSGREVLLLHLAGHTFVAPDNGLLWPLWEMHRVEARAFHLRELQGFCLPPSSTFHGRDIFAPVGAWIARSVPLITLGEPIERPRVALESPKPLVGRSHVEGEVILVDPFGNLVTNIVPRLLPGDISEVSVGEVTIEGIARSYSHWGEGPGVIVNSCGHLEVFLFMGSAAEALGVGVGERVLVRLK